jgi:hypothetical protein
MQPSKAGDAIRGKLQGKSALTLTVADAAAKTGLALRDADSGLKWLSTEYRGQLRVTAGGELVHVFPSGFNKPWEGRETRQRVLRAAGRAVGGALRFIVRAWVAIVLVGYAALFLALVLAMTFARQGNDSNSRRGGDLPGGALAYAFFRVLGDALFWTFHPWSPFSVYAGPAWGAPAYGAPSYAERRERARSQGPRVPLYERVNRFFFGPPQPPVDPRENERLIVAAIRAGKGRIGLADVMRVTGLPREQADPLMARLMLDYEGDVGVSEEGGIFYRFPALRKTAAEAGGSLASPDRGVAGAGAPDEPPQPAWAPARVKPLPPLTGNSAGANFVIVALNTFNLLMATWALENGMTIDRVVHLFERVPRGVVQPVLDTGLPIALGVVPLVFSALLFLVPVARAVARPWKERDAAREKGRLAVLRVVLEKLRAKQPVTDAAVAQAWRVATGHDAPPKSLDRELVALGGDVAIEPSGATRWRFADLETEAAAVAAEREAASEEEARLGEVVYATDER